MKIRGVKTTYNDMTNQDYEKARQECWDEYTRKCANEGKSAYGAFSFAFDRAFTLGMKIGNSDFSDAEESVISGWAARDKDGNLFAYCKKPERNEELQVWMGGFADFGLRNSLFPDLTWDDDPIEVELTIKRKNNG